MADLVGTERGGSTSTAVATDWATVGAATQRAVLVAAVLGTALAYMSDDMLNLAIPSVARQLGATLTDIQWVVNAYYVTLVSFVLIAGSIGDIVGHRRVFAAGLGLFSLGAFGCAAAPSIAVLVVGRAAQGVGASMVLTAGLALVTRLSRPDDRNRSVGRFFGLVAAIPALGPFISGAMVDLLSWRWLFVVPLMLPLAAAVITFRGVPETPRAEGRSPDLAGAALGLVALASASIALILGPLGAEGMVAAGAALVAVIAGAAFVVQEHRAVDPMLPLRFFRNPVFLGGNVVWLLGCLTSWGAVFFLAVTLQTTLGLRPIVAGTVLIPIYLVMMVGSPLAGRLAGRIGPRRPILAGLALYAVGLWLLGQVGPGTPVVPDVIAAIGVFAVGMAVFTAPLAAVTMGSVSDADQGLASGVNNAMGNLAGLLAIVILPAAAGLAGAGVGGPEFAAGYRQAMLVATGIAAAGALVAAVTVRTGASMARTETD